MADIVEVLRVEKKYTMSMQEIHRLAGILRQTLPGDTNNGMDGGYLVRSLYFDTISDIDYAEKEEGLEQRKKIRLRIYHPEDKTAKLELKEKQGEFQRKQSLTITRADAYELIRGNYGVLMNQNTAIAEELYCTMTMQLYRPKCLVQYKRQAFTVKENDIRITLDTKLLASETNLDLFAENAAYYPVDVQDKGVLEVKYNRFLLSYIKEILSLSGRTQISYSKYCTARRITKGI